MFILKILSYPFKAMSQYLFSFTIVKDIVIVVAANEAITFFDLDKKISKMAEEIKADRQTLLESKNSDTNNPYQALPLNNDIPWISSQFVSNHFETVMNTALLLATSGILYVVENKTRRGITLSSTQAKEYIVDQVARGSIKAKSTIQKGAEFTKKTTKQATDFTKLKIDGGINSAGTLLASGKQLAIYSLGHLRINAHLMSYMAMNFGSFVVKGSKGLTISVIDFFRTIPFFLTKEQKAKFMLKLVDIARQTGSRIHIKKINGKSFIYTTMGAGSFGVFCYMMLEYIFNESEVVGQSKLTSNNVLLNTPTNLQRSITDNHKKLFLLIGKAISRLDDIRKLQYAGSLETSISTKFGDNRDVKHAAFKMADLIISQLLQRLAMKGTPSVSTHILTVTNIIIQVLEYLNNPDGIKLASLRFISKIVNNIIDYNSGSFTGDKVLFTTNLGVKTSNHIHIDAMVDNRMSNNVIDDEEYWRANSASYDVINNSLWDKSIGNNKLSPDVPTPQTKSSAEYINSEKEINIKHPANVNIPSSVVANLRNYLNSSDKSVI